MKEGQLKSMWRVDLNGISSLLKNSHKIFSWESITPKGKGPEKISHHVCATFKDCENVVLYGGLKGDNDNGDVYIYDIPHNSWSTL